VSCGMARVVRARSCNKRRKDFNPFMGVSRARLVLAVHTILSDQNAERTAEAGCTRIQAQVWGAAPGEFGRGCAYFFRERMYLTTSVIWAGVSLPSYLGIFPLPLVMMPVRSASDLP
jgi:hypothetical protein